MVKDEELACTKEFSNYCEIRKTVSKMINSKAPTNKTSINV